MRKVFLLLGLCLIPQTGHAQHTAFSSLFDGYVTYRPTASWRVLRSIQGRHSEGVLLAGRNEGDSSLSAALIAYPTPAYGRFESFADSLFIELAPGPEAIRTWQGGSDSLRIVIWTAKTPDGPIIAIDRLLLLPGAALYARVAMPAIPPANPDQIPLRLEMIDDFLTSVHAEGRVLFPGGAQFAVKVF